MVILEGQNKITDFFMILAWASLFNQAHTYRIFLSFFEKSDMISMFSQTYLSWSDVKLALSYFIILCCFN